MVSPSALVARLVELVPIARRGAEPEGVHQLRVVSRRLDVWLRLAGLRLLRDDLRWLRVVCAVPRDLDVLVALPGSPAERRRLRAARRRAQPALVAALDGPRAAGLLAALEVLRPIPIEAARSRVPRLIRTLRARGASIESPEADDVAFHALRRALRRVRFALELVEVTLPELRGAQDALGALGDHALLARWRTEHGLPAPAEDLPALRIAAREAWFTARGALDTLEASWS